MPQMITTLAVLFLLLSSCSCPALRSRWDREHDDFLDRLKAQREILDPRAYKKLIEKELAIKEQALLQLQQYRDHRRGQMLYDEAANSGQSPQDVASFKVKSGQIEQEQLARRIEILERETFFLKTQQSLSP